MHTCACQSTNIFFWSCFLQGFSKVIKAGLQSKGSKQFPAPPEGSGHRALLFCILPNAPAFGFRLPQYILKLFNNLAKSRWGGRENKVKREGERQLLCSLCLQKTAQAPFGLRFNLLGSGELRFTAPQLLQAVAHWGSGRERVGAALISEELPQRGCGIHRT